MKPGDFNLGLFSGESPHLNSGKEFWEVTRKKGLEFANSLTKGNLTAKKNAHIVKIAALASQYNDKGEVVIHPEVERYLTMKIGASMGEFGIANGLVTQIQTQIGMPSAMPSNVMLRAQGNEIAKPQNGHVKIHHRSRDKRELEGSDDDY